MPSSYNVLIVGAGVAGPALAYALATKTYEKRDVPLRIALLERSLSKPDRIVAELLQPGGVTAVKKLGVLASKAGGQPESYFADLVVLADGSSSKFRTAVLGKMQYEPLQGGYFAGLIVKDLKLLMPEYVTMALLKGAGPVILFELPDNTHRMMIELKRPPPDLKLPSSVRGPILNALETSRVRRVPHYYLPPTKQGGSSKAGAFLLGDSLNVRHPLTAGGMTVALNDVVIISDLLAHIENFGNWDEISAVLRKWHHLRKPLAHTINVMSMGWAGIFSAEGEAFSIVQEGSFKYMKKGVEYAEAPMSLAAGPGNKSAPRFYEYPLLFIKALNVIWTIGMVLGPVMWAEM
ncbi:squalene epoxidase-domain-containing protein [Suillus americanus]|nr:squalene epoxidase-domain-containing protein [Suillus americanus]